jgi:hypothetical protein
MQPHCLVVGIGRTWWAQSSMAENPSRVKQNGSRVAKKAQTATKDPDNLLFSMHFGEKNATIPFHQRRKWVDF